MLIHRRGLLVAGLGAGALLAAGPSRGGAAGAQGSDAGLAQQVDAGLAYFRERAEAQKPLVAALTEAIRSDDIAAATAAYVASRPPYEEIEVLALCFAETDEAIDARPYAFEQGETSEDFRGFHRIEALLFRDEDLAGALPYAEELQGSVDRLAADLATRANFSAQDSFAGMIGLATEIPAKKISSEEEVWSDRSLLIFKHNLVGIHSQAKPFLPALAETDEARGRRLEETFEAARAAVDAVYGREPGGALYSTIRTAERKAISTAVYAYRDALAAAAEALDLA